MESEAKVLIIDDDDVFLFLHAMLVKDSGLSQDPLSFITAQSALDYLEANHASHKEFFVLLDINMPAMCGWQFLDYLENTAYKDKVSIILVTSSIEDAAHQKADTYSTVRAYIEKPLSLEICSRLREEFMQ